MKCLCFHYISLLLATFILSQIPAWAGKKSSNQKTACTKDVMTGTDEDHDGNSEPRTLGDIFERKDDTTLADSVLKILDASRILSVPKNIYTDAVSHSWEHKKHDQITEEDHKKILKNEIQLNHFYLLSYSGKTGETIAKSLKKQGRELAKEFYKLDDIDPAITQESQDVLNIILKPEEYRFSKEIIGSFYEELEDNNGNELSAPKWLDSHDNKTFLPLVFLNKLWKETKTPLTPKPNKLQKSQKKSRKVSDSASPNKQTCWEGYKIPKKKAKLNTPHDTKTNLTVNSGFAGKDNPFRFDESNK